MAGRRVTKKPDYKTVNFYVLHLNFGGIESAVSNVANMLADDYKVTIVSFYNYGSPAFKLKDSVQVEFLTSYQSIRGDIFKAGSPLQTLRSFFLAAKILFLRKWLVKRHVRQTEAGILFSSRLMFHKIISEAGEDKIKICQEHVDHKGDTSYIRRVVDATKKSDYLMPVSQFLSEEYQQQIGSKSVYIRHATSVPSSYKYQFSKNLISVGRLSPEKGFLDLIDVFKLVIDKDDEYRLDIFGDGVEMQQITDKISKYNLNDKVNLHGFKTKELIAEYLQKAGLFVMTSLEESFGLVLIEAFAYGVPAIAFDSARGAREIINSSNGILIKNRNLNTMAEAILLFGQRADKLSSGARRAALSYSFESVKRDYLGFIKKATNDKIQARRLND